MDFFSILLPGALLTWLLMGEVGPAVLGDRYAALTGHGGIRSCLRDGDPRRRVAARLARWE
jgi:hypothetical protein